MSCAAEIDLCMRSPKWQSIETLTDTLSKSMHWMLPSWLLVTALHSTSRSVSRTFRPAFTSTYSTMPGAQITRSGAEAIGRIASAFLLRRLWPELNRIDRTIWGGKSHETDEMQTT